VRAPAWQRRRLPAPRPPRGCACSRRRRLAAPTGQRCRSPLEVVEDAAVGLKQLHKLGDAQGADVPTCDVLGVRRSIDPNQK